MVITITTAQLGYSFRLLAGDFFWFLLFTRLLPPVAIAELKEVLPPPMRGARKEGAA